MSESVSTGTDGNSDAATAETPVESTETQNTSQPNTVEELPEFARNLIAQLRQENAKHRTAKSQAVEATKAETQSEFETKLTEANNAHEVTKSQLNDATLLLAKLNAAIEGGVPTEKLLAVASRLNGTTEDEIKADVDVVKTLFGIAEPTPPPAAVDPSQGVSTSPKVQQDEFGSFLLGLLDNR